MSFFMSMKRIVKGGFFLLGITLIDFNGRKTLTTLRALSFTEPNESSRILQEIKKLKLSSYPEMITIVSIMFQPFLR